MAEKKNYLKGSIREFKYDSTGDSKIVLSLSLESLQSIVNDKGYVNFIVQPRREADAFNNTHYAYENDYKPAAKTGQATVAAKKAGVKPPTFKQAAPEDDFNPF